MIGYIMYYFYLVYRLIVYNKNLSIDQYQVIILDSQVHIFFNLNYRINQPSKSNQFQPYPSINFIQLHSQLFLNYQIWYQLSI